MSMNLLISLLIVRALVIAVCTTRLNDNLKSAFCPRGIFMFLTTLTINYDYFPGQYQLSGLSNFGILCFVRGTRCVFM